MNAHEEEKRKLVEEPVLHQFEERDRDALINEVKELNKLINIYHNEAQRRKNKYVLKI